MGYNADGTWDAEDENVQRQVASVVSAGGPLMKRARGIGLALANGRGLANSSIAVGSAQGQVLDRAIQIGGQAAQQASAKKIQAASDAAALERTNLTLASQEREGAAGRSLQASEGSAQRAQQLAMFDKQVAADMATVNARIAADKDLAAAGDKSAMERLNANLQAQAELQDKADRSALERQMLSQAGAISLQQAADLAAADRLSTTVNADLIRDRQQQQAAQEIQRQQDEAAAQRQQSQNATSLTLGEMEQQTSKTNTAVSASANLNAAYQTALANLMQNEKIPADARNSMIESLQQSTEMSIGLVEQITGLNLQWGRNQ